MPEPKKLPAILFYPGDWRKDPGVQSLDYFTRGVWIEMLCIMAECNPRGYLAVGGKAITDEALGRMLGLDPARLTHELTLLLTNGTASRDERNGAIYSRRMVRDEHKRSLDQKHGALGGNPKLLNPPVNPPDKPGDSPAPVTPPLSIKSSQVKSSQIMSDQVKKTPDTEAASPPPAKEIKQKAIFIAPTLEEVTAFACEIGATVSQASDYFHNKTTIGWVQGKGATPMKDWRAGFQYWLRPKEWQTKQGQGTARKPYRDEDEDRSFPSIAHRVKS